MADYYPLVAKAIAGLEKNTGEGRRALYERARTALVAQLRGMNDPPLTEAEITRERLALEEAIRKVEAEAARRGRDAPRAEPAAAKPDTGADASQSAPAKPAASERPATPPRPPQRQSPMRQPSADDIGELPKHSRAGLVAAIVTVLLILALGAAAYWQRDRIAALVAGVRGTATQQPKDATATKPKITDRVGQPPAQSETQPPAAGQNAAPVAAVAQRVVLYEEDPADPQGKRYVGSAIWRTETVTPGPGAAPDPAVRDHLEIPERRITMTFSLRRNTDQALPASHTIEVTFNLPADFPFGGISNVPGILMKQAEQTRGAPLAGLAVKVTSGFFLVGLSAVEGDMQRNIQLLKERSWFDIPIVYNNGRRAILAIEKGTPGERAFEDVFKAWGQ